MRTWLMVAALLLAGCAQDAEVDGTKDPGQPEGSHESKAGADDERRFGTAGDNASLTYVLPLDGHDVAAFQIDVPEHAAHPLTDGSTFTYQEMLIGADPGDDEAMSVFIFSSGGHPLLISPFTPTETTTYLTAALPSTDHGVDWSTRLWRTDPDVMTDTLWVIVAGGGNGTAVIHFAPDSQFGVFEHPSASMLASGVPPSTAVGTGNDWEFHLYTELAIGLVETPGIIGLVATSGQTLVEERVPTYVFPHGGVRDASLSAATEATLGWHYATTSGFGFGNGATLWNHEVRAPGASASNDGVGTYGKLYGYVATALLFGLPVGVAYGDGDTGAHAQVDLEQVTDNELHTAGVATARFSPGLSELTGLTAPSDAGAFEGLVPTLLLDRSLKAP